MKPDPIITEIRQTREAYAAQFAGNIRAMLDDLRQRQQDNGRKAVNRTPKLLKQSRSR